MPLASPAKRKMYSRLLALNTSRNMNNRSMYPLKLLNKCFKPPSFID
jgi:hypothetical protein